MFRSKKAAIPEEFYDIIFNIIIPTVIFVILLGVVVAASSSDAFLLPFQAKDMRNVIEMAASSDGAVLVAFTPQLNNLEYMYEQEELVLLDGRSYSTIPLLLPDMLAFVDEVSEYSQNNDVEELLIFKTDVLRMHTSDNPIPFRSLPYILYTQDCPTGFTPSYTVSQSQSPYFTQQLPQSQDAQHTVDVLITDKETEAVIIEVPDFVEYDALVCQIQKKLAEKDPAYHVIKNPFGPTAFNHMRFYFDKDQSDQMNIVLETLRGAQ